MIYSYTQISQYLACPRRYRHRYLDGWQEKDTRAAMLFGRAFEQALAAYFRREDAAVSLYREWLPYQKQPLHFSDRDSWDSMLQQGIELLERFSQDDRVRVRQPRRNLQIKFVRPLAGGNNDFVAYVDAIGRLDGRACLLEWKTTSSRYPEEPEGLLALDPQLVCYSWITGIHDVAEVVFVRKRLVEIQYLRTTITDEQRNEFAQLVQDTIRQIESARFLPHSGIRFPQNPCISCPYVGLCLGKPQLVEAVLIRRPGAEDFGVFDEFLERRFPESRRKAYYLMSIHEHLPPQVRKELKQMGWTKGRELAKLVRAQGQHFDCAPWVHKACTMPREQFQREIEKELTGKETEPWEIVYFKLYKSQIPVIEQALETAALMLGSDRSRGYCLEMICADFLAGANLDSGNPDALLQALSRSLRFLPAEQRQLFLHYATTAS